MFDQENMPLLSSINHNADVKGWAFTVFLLYNCRWKRMPKHIKVSKHADTRKFYVSDVCEFLSVEVSTRCLALFSLISSVVH